MANTVLLGFRSFLTEKFTCAAVEVFEEVENLMESLYEENKRLKTVLHMVLSPQIKLSSIDISQYTTATKNVSKDSLQTSTASDCNISECLANGPKEEPIEYDINWGLEQQCELEEAEQFIPSDCLKEEDDTNMQSIMDTLNVKVVEMSPDSSSSSDDEEGHFSEEMESAKDNANISQEKKITSRSLAFQDSHETTKTTKLKKPRQKTMLEFPRMRSLRSFIPALPDTQSLVSRITEFKDFPDDQKPLITQMGLTTDMEMVECAFGKVPKGSPLSYQYPVPSGRDYQIIDDAPPRPTLPLSNHALVKMKVLPTFNAREQELLNALQTTWEAANTLEESTRDSKESVTELQNLRLTSRFREICLAGQSLSKAQHLVFKIKKGLQGVRKSKTAQIEEEMKTDALREYCRHLCVNYYPCGFIVHPTAPWLGATPHGLVYDPKEMDSFGLVHVKCVNQQSFIDCTFLACKDGELQLKRNHPYYWHIQGEMMVTGTSWCDLLVLSKEDMLVQRIYRNKGIIRNMKKKVDEFFFYYYLPGQR